MVTLKVIRKIIQDFPEASEEPHFEKISFRVRKKIFATYNHEEKRISVKLSPNDQDLFTSTDKTIIFPVPNKWGKLGWTLIDIRKIKTALLKEALVAAFCEVAPSGLSKTIR
jgi:predicted DNA-binding protein (MmcQ/YjbR family)